MGTPENNQETESTGARHKQTLLTETTIQQRTKNKGRGLTYIGKLIRNKGQVSELMRDRCRQSDRRETQGQEVESPRLIYKIKQEMCKNNRKQMNKMTRAEGQGTDHDRSS